MLESRPRRFLLPFGMNRARGESRCHPVLTELFQIQCSLVRYERLLNEKLHGENPAFDSEPSSCT